MSRSLLENVDVAQLAIARDVDWIGIAPHLVLTAVGIKCGDMGAHVFTDGRGRMQGLKLARTRRVFPCELLIGE